MAATPVTAAPPTIITRGPTRSSMMPLTGVPQKRPVAQAVTVWAAAPMEISKYPANTGMVGSTMPQASPENRELPYNRRKLRSTRGPSQAVGVTVREPFHGPEGG